MTQRLLAALMALGVAVGVVVYTTAAPREDCSPVAVVTREAAGEFLRPGTACTVDGGVEIRVPELVGQPSQLLQSMACDEGATFGGQPICDAGVALNVSTLTGPRPGAAP